MAGMTAALQKSLLDHYLGLAVYTAPAARYLSLHTAPPTDTGSHAHEVASTGTGYARQPIDGKFAATDSVTGISVNSGTITFPVIAAAYGVVTDLGIDDAATAGTMGLSGSLSEPQLKLVGQAYQFAPSQAAIAFA